MDQKENLTPEQFTERLQTEVEKHIHQAVSVYQNLSEARLNQPPAEGGWSITQCLEHLNSYSRHYLPLIHKAVICQSYKPVNKVRLGWLGSYFIQMMNPDGRPYRYKAAAQHRPASDLDAGSVVAAFITHQEELLVLLGQAVYTNLNGSRIPISISPLIKLRLAATLAFLIMHDERHIRQADCHLSADR